MKDLKGGMLALEHYYKIQEIRAYTQWGVSYKAVVDPLSKPVTLWTLEKLVEMGANAQLLERIKIQIQKASLLSHKNHLHIVDYGHLEGEIPFIVTEHAPLNSLEHLLESEGPLSLRQSYDILRQIVDALDHAHHSKLIHGGLAPSKILIQKRDYDDQIEVKVWGYGQALRRGELQWLDRGLLNLSAFEHLPPEAFIEGQDGIVYYYQHQIWGTGDAQEAWEAARRVDVYGLGLLAYYCLTGQHPFFDKNKELSEGILAIMHRPPQSLKAFEIPQKIESLIFKALSKNPNERDLSLKGWIHAFREALPKEEEQCEVVHLPPTVQDPLKRPWYAVLWKSLVEMIPQKMRWLFEDSRARNTALALLFVTNVITLLALLQIQWLRGHDNAGEAVFHLPTATGEGIDLVFIPLSNPKSKVYLAGPNGGLKDLGAPPFLIRNQMNGGKIRMILQDQDHVMHPVEIFIEDQGDRLMYIDFDNVLKEQKDPMLDHRRTT